jgi:large subunit ribosomal protein L4
MAAPSAPWLGKGQGKVSLDETVFSERFHGPLVHEAARAEQNAKRRGTASTKSRGEVAMTGAKAWRQKGTGRARVGALSAGQRTGGGVIFGPKPRGYTMKVNRKARRRALRAALTLHAERGSLAAIDASGFDAPSTKQAFEAISDFTPFGSTGGDGGSALIVLADGEEACAKSFRNIAGVSVLHASEVGVADLVGAARLVASEAALEQLTARASS